MASRVKFRKLAEADLNTVFKWYEHQRPGLGREFFAAFEEALSVISRFPETFPVKYENVRIYSLKQFPYSIYYRVFSKWITVLAVYHQHRNPKRWQKRK